MKRSSNLALLIGCMTGVLLTITFGACNPGYSAETSAGGDATVPVHAFTLNDIDGNPLGLDTFTGKVLLLVNTASMCGNTPQYEGLQTLYEQYRERGLEILAFPANNFGKQEPGTNEEIKSFCYTKYALEFPLFSKISVKGEDMHPLYHYLTTQSPFPGEIEWNFQKFLVNREGEIIARYRPGLKPLSAQIVQDIERALDKS
ncbi:MAG: glutathione peroxidase [Nitrospira sp.]|nr:glutathione peroxidase [Nitrospira sp.]